MQQIIKLLKIQNSCTDTTTLIHINQCNTDKLNFEKIGDVNKKMPDKRGLMTGTVLNTKISEVVNKIPNTSSSVTTAVSNTIISEAENKIPGNSKYITTQEFNKLTAENSEARLKQADLFYKTDLDNKLTSFNKGNTSNRTKHLEEQKNINSL